VERFHQDAFSYYDRLTPVLQFVNTHVSKPISLDAAAKVAGLERKYFSAFFRSKVGITFTEWIRLLRVRRSMELMRAHDDSILRIAFAAGFRDVRTFERAFKRYVGVSPTAYRSSVRPEHDGRRELHDQRRASPRIAAHIGSAKTR
jgi:transcriptional regulator GlxA family with amidase domain